MKKIYCILLFLCLLQSAFCAEELTQPNVPKFQDDFIQGFQSGLPPGWTYRYDDIQTTDKPDFQELRIKNLSVTSDQNESIFSQNGELILSLSENEASIVTNGSFKIRGKAEAALPISFKLGVGKNIWSLQTMNFETFYAALQYVEFSLGKGSVTYTTETGEVLTLAKIDSQLFRIAKVKDDEHSSQFSLYSSIKNMSFPDLTTGNINKYIGDWNQDFAVTARMLSIYGVINSEVKGSFTLPSGKEFVAMHQTPPSSYDEVLVKMMRYGWGFGFASTASNALISDKAQFLFKPETGKIDLLYQSDFIPASDLAKKMPEFILDILNMQAYRFSIEEVKRFVTYITQHRSEWDALFENFVPTNNGSILFDLKAKTNEAISNGKLDFLFKLATEKTDFLFKIDGTLLSDNLSEPGSTRGKVTISLNDYAKVLDAILETQNRFSQFMQGYNPSYQPIDGAPYINFIKEWIKFVDPKAAAGDKNMSILFDYSNPDSPKIGSRTLAEIQNGPKPPQ